MLVNCSNSVCALIQNDSDFFVNSVTPKLTMPCFRNAQSSKRMSYLIFVGAKFSDL